MFNVVEDGFKIFRFFWKGFFDDDYFEEVLIWFGCEMVLDCFFMDEDEVKKVCFCLSILNFFVNI